MTDIQKCWNETKFHSNITGSSNRRQTALQALAERYRRFSRMALIFVIVSPSWIWSIFRDSIEDNYGSIWFLQTFMIVYFMLAFFMDRWLANGISKINVAEIPVAEVCRLAYYYRKKHFQFMAVLIPMAVVLILCLTHLFAFDRYVIYGIISGSVFGLAIAFYQLSRFLGEYRDILSE